MAPILAHCLIMVNADIDICAKAVYIVQFQIQIGACRP